MRLFNLIWISRGALALRETFPTENTSDRRRWSRRAPTASLLSVGHSRSCNVSQLAHALVERDEHLLDASNGIGIQQRLAALAANPCRHFVQHDHVPIARVRVGRRSPFEVTLALQASHRAPPFRVIPSSSHWAGSGTQAVMTLRSGQANIVQNHLRRMVAE